MDGSVCADFCRLLISLKKKTRGAEAEEKEEAVYLLEEEMKKP